MSDRVILAGVETYAWGGVTEAEQAVGQRYELQLELELDVARAGRTDELTDTISYADVHDLAVRVLRERPFKLIEAAATRVADKVLEAFPVESVTVELRKLNPPIDGTVAYAAVRIARRRST